MLVFRNFHVLVIELFGVTLWQHGFSVDSCAGFCVLAALGKNDQQNAPENRPSKSFKSFTTKVPHAFLQTSSATLFHVELLQLSEVIKEPLPSKPKIPLSATRCSTKALRLGERTLKNQQGEERRSKSTSTLYEDDPFKLGFSVVRVK